MRFDTFGRRAGLAGLGWLIRLAVLCPRDGRARGQGTVGRAPRGPVDSLPPVQTHRIASVGLCFNTAQLLHFSNVCFPPVYVVRSVYVALGTCCHN